MHSSNDAETSNLGPARLDEDPDSRPGVVIGSKEEPTFGAVEVILAPAIVVC